MFSIPLVSFLIPFSRWLECTEKKSYGIENDSQKREYFWDSDLKSEKNSNENKLNRHCEPKIQRKNYLLNSDQVSIWS